MISSCAPQSQIGSKITRPSRNAWLPRAWRGPAYTQPGSLSSPVTSSEVSSATMTGDEPFGAAALESATEVQGRRSPFPETLRRLVASLVLENAAEGIWLIDADARTTFVNSRIADLLGYTEEEM